ncbi:MAG: GGDEF domain-containing protein [Oscillibacter sp.]|jgi:diguanylate cyclase (GGDEF)-like protein|nr:GGDEF domain-containing protein [Oscillibacter sp.]
MSKKGIAFHEYVGRLLKNTSDRRIADAINMRNIRNVYVFSALAGIFDAVSLILYSAKNFDNPIFWRTFFNVSCYVAIFVTFTVLSRAMMRKYEKDGKLSNIRVNLLLTIFYILLSAWGIGVDVMHYKAGEQMLTFYIVQFCFVCFVVMLPKLGGTLIALSFLILYLNVYSADGAARIQPQNYILFAVIAVLGNAIQYHMLQKAEQQKVNILELNQIFQQEASVDDLTKLKNRKALRCDFDKHMGKSVYVMMMDVDRFKSYNDTYGHVAGDKVLWTVASAAKEAFQDGDAYRYGGDEFLVILGDCAEEEFQEKIEKWEELTRSIQIPDTTRPVTCSYGYDHHMIRNTEDMRDAIRIADDRLYEMKNARCGDSASSDKTDPQN